MHPEKQEKEEGGGRNVEIVREMEEWSSALAYLRFTQGKLGVAHWIWLLLLPCTLPFNVTPRV